MRPWVVGAVLLALMLAGCGGDGGADEGDSTDDGVSASTVAGGEFDPNALAIYIGEGATVSRVEPGNDITTELVGGLTDCYETWFIDASVWVACSDGRLLRIEPETGDIQLDVETGSYVEEIVIGDGGIWVLNGQVGISTEINQIDPASGEIVATVTPAEGAFFEDIAVGEGAVWAVGGSAETVAVIARIDPSNATVSTLIDTGIGAARVDVGYGSVWVVGDGFLNPDGSGDGGEQLVRIDPATNEVVAQLKVGEVDGFPDIAIAYDSVWLTDTPAGELVRVDQEASEVQARIAVGSGGQDLFEIDVAKGLVWVGNPFDGQIIGVDPTTDEFDTGIDGGAKGIAFAP